MKTLVRKRRTIKAQVLSLIKRGWKDHIDIYESIDGDAMRRLRELRSEGINISKRYNPNTQTFQYRVSR